MDQVKRKVVITIVSVILVSSGLITILSVPIGLFPPIGDFLLPGDGLWNINAEVDEYEIITNEQLESDVLVYRDEWGIPHIYGYSEEDILYALGYVHAQDRLFQMDLARRATQGKLSELLGGQTLQMDRLALTKLMDYWTGETVDNLVASTDPLDIHLVNCLNSYADGINYFIDTEKYLPLEFEFLNYKPDYWTLHDTFCFIKYMSEMLTWSYSDFVNVVIKDAIGIQGFDELFGYNIPYQVPITSDYGQDFNGSLEIQRSIEDSVNDVLVGLCKDTLEAIEAIGRENQFLHQRDIIGSNNWAISGTKTATGKPFLSNDMHLGFNLPGIWYEAHLVNQKPGEELNLYGFFLAGVPYPIVGHNDYISWGMTNTGYDVIDWYYYDEINSTHYWYKGIATPYTEINYEIKIKGAGTELFTIKSTVDGPVFSNSFLYNFDTNYVDKVIACRWIAHSITDEGRAIYEFAHSKNRSDFDEASKLFSTPAQNLVYADIYGNIGIRPTGKVPIRNDTGIPAWHTGNGTMVYNGSAGQGAWIDYVPFENLPHTENPSQGYVFSANQIVAGPDFLKNYTLQNPLSISQGYRARRINDLLAGNDDITIDDMKRFLLDCYSVKAGNFTSYLLNAVDSMPSKTPLQQSIYDGLASWDFLMDCNAYQPTIFNLWIEIYLYETFYDDVLDAGSPILPSTAVLEWLTKNNATSKWFDNKETLNTETRDDIIIIAFEKTVAELSNYLYSTHDDITEWLWGFIHQLRVEHLTGFEPLGYGPVPVNGTGDTVSPFVGNRLWNGDYIQLSYCDFGSSERMIIDLSNMSNSISIIPSGERGISTSKHYTDLLEMYLKGEYHQQYFAYTNDADFEVLGYESKIWFKSGDE